MNVRAELAQYDLYRMPRLDRITPGLSWLSFEYADTRKSYSPPDWMMGEYTQSVLVKSTSASLGFLFHNFMSADLSSLPIFSSTSWENASWVISVPRSINDSILDLKYFSMHVETRRAAVMVESCTHQLRPQSRSQSRPGPWQPGWPTWQR